MVVSPVSVMVVSPVPMMVVSPVSVMVVSPVCTMVSVVCWRIHHSRSSNHHRCGRHVYGLRGDQDRNRQPKTKGHMDPSCVGRKRQQGKAYETQEGNNTKGS